MKMTLINDQTQIEKMIILIIILFELIEAKEHLIRDFLELYL